jgi:hypothetical protein
MKFSQCSGTLKKITFHEVFTNIRNIRSFFDAASVDLAALPLFHAVIAVVDKVYFIYILSSLDQDDDKKFQENS